MMNSHQLLEQRAQGAAARLTPPRSWSTRSRMELHHRVQSLAIEGHHTRSRIRRYMAPYKATATADILAHSVVMGIVPFSQVLAEAVSWSL